MTTAIIPNSQSGSWVGVRVASAWRAVGVGLVSAGLVALLGGCATEGEAVVRSEEGCTRPPVLAKYNIRTLDIASTTVGKFQLGGFHYQDDPKTVDVFSELAKDGLVIDYQVCLALHKHGYTPEQAEWLRGHLLFMKTNPTPDQADRWLTAHPFPGRGAGGGSTVIQESSGDFSPNNLGSGSVTIIRQ